MNIIVGQCLSGRAALLRTLGTHTLHSERSKEYFHTLYYSNNSVKSLHDRLSLSENKESLLSFSRPNLLQYYTQGH